MTRNQESSHWTLTYKTKQKQMTKKTRNKEDHEPGVKPFYSDESLEKMVKWAVDLFLELTRGGAVGHNLFC